MGCFGLATAWVLASRGSIGSRWCLTAVALFFWIAATDAVPQAVIRVLSAGYTPLTAAMVPDGHIAVVLLGAGTYQAIDWSEHQYTVLGRVAADRVLEAERVYGLVKPDFILSSGGLARRANGFRGAGLEMAEVLAQRGVPRDRILSETRSVNTRDEAAIVRRMLDERPVDHVILVTSDFHMRRSVATFRSEGLDVIPAIAHATAPFHAWWGSLVPTDKGLQDTSLVAHELAGIAIYWLRGWSK